MIFPYFKAIEAAVFLRKYLLEYAINVQIEIEFEKNLDI